ncbi:MAG: hypothetical protein MJK04_01315 [Psychrosphaera sp.]|nr:hypothetical protein [Psychrosphaera sp.]
MNKKYLSRTLLISSIVVASYLMLTMQWAHIQAEDIEVKFTLVSSNVLQDKPVLVDFQVTNNSNNAIELDLGPQKVGFIEFDIKSTNQSDFKRYKLNFTERSLEDSCRLAPGEKCESRFTLNRWYSFKTPGTFEVRPHLNSPIVTSTEQLQPVVNSAMKLQLMANPTTVKASDIVTTFKLREAKISLHEPVLVDFSITNHAREAVTIDLGSNSISAIEFDILQPRQTAFTRFKISGIDEVNIKGRNGTGFGRLEVSAAVGEKRLGPGDSYNKTLILNKWLAFSGPGKYQIKPVLDAPIITRSGQFTATEPPNLLLQVTPRDEKRLKQRAKALLKNGSEITSGAEMLSYMNDRAAFEPVNHLLKGKGKGEGKGKTLNRHYAIRTLERMANVEAVTILVKQFEQTGYDKRSPLHWALFKISETSYDAKVVSLATSALQQAKDN